jgi:hypothetical protein
MEGSDETGRGRQAPAPNAGEATRDGGWRRGPVLPGLPGHDPAGPAPAVLHWIDEEAARLAHRWYRFPPIERVVKHRGVSLMEALEYHFAAPFVQALVRLVEQGAAPAGAAEGSERQGPAPDEGASEGDGER